MILKLVHKTEKKIKKQKVFDKGKLLKYFDGKLDDVYDGKLIYPLLMKITALNT